MGIRGNWAVIVARVVAIVIGLGLWYLTQALLAKREKRLAATPRSPEDGPICDRIHDLSARLHRRFFDNPRKANALLISSSLVIDLLGFYLLGSAIFGSTIQ